MRKITYTAHIEKDEESGLYVGYIPAIPGAHTQADDLKTLHDNLEEILALCISEMSEKEIEQASSNFIGIHQVSVAV